VVYVPINAKWWETVQFLPSKAEAKILGTLARIERGNAYQIWKNSGLKHYPTVLRTLKKLEKKRLVRALDVKSTRGGKAFSSTVQGTLVFYISSGVERKIVELAMRESSLLRELYKTEKDDDLVFAAAREVILESCKEGRPYSFDNAIQHTIMWSIIDNLNDGIWNRIPEGLEWLTKMSNIGWIRDLIFEYIKKERQSIAKATKSLDAFDSSLRT